jgi:transcriptional regulator with XRE-family HTH domain
VEETTSFGPWLRRQRKGRDLTQDALARQVGCAVITIQKSEADERRPSQDIAARLADILQVPTEERVVFLNVARGELAVDHLDGGAQGSWHLVATPLHNLPTPPNPLIGRTREVEDLLALVRRPDVRLVTLTGPGGTGKTRLGIRVATELLADFMDGVRFVALAAITDPALVLPTIAQALGVRQLAGQSLLDSLETALHGRHLLLVLDNFEQVLDAALDVAALLVLAPRLSIVVTSRTPLHLSGEHEFAVPPLALPVSNAQLQPAHLTQYAAVALFIARAQAKRRDFHVTDAMAPAIATICVRLDGLPLAIELAAARCKALTPEAILVRLEHRFELLTGGTRDLPARQQTIRATMDWSYKLLDSAVQQLFWRLGVFAVDGR